MTTVSQCGASATYGFDLLCIGSGPAGQRAAVEAAKLGCRVAGAEKRHIVGGICVDTATIPSKTLVGAAEHELAECYKVAALNAANEFLR